MLYLMHQIVDRWAHKTPDSPAFRCLEQTLTYRELDDQSGRLACALQELGVHRGDRVGIYLNKSIETAVAVYGILEAGAVYVPLDPSAPLSRLRRSRERGSVGRRRRSFRDAVRHRRSPELAGRAQL